MKIKVILSLLILVSTSLKAQWNPAGATTGNIYYNNGNVGIGTITPPYKTVISHNGAAGLEIDPTGLQFSEGVGIQTYNRSTDAYLPFQIYSSKLVLGGGNIGIGTTNPLYKIVISNNNGVGIEIDPAGTQLPGGVGIQAYNRTTSSYTPLQIYGSKLILDGGNVLIGKTTQANLAYKLDVNGSIRSNEIVVNTDGADFVFEPDYDLKDLAEVEKFIKDNKHLPDIESAKEMAEKGLELGKMDMKLLQKVEELTLYMIDLKKEINVLKEENQKLNAKIVELKGN